MKIYWYIGKTLIISTLMVALIFCGLIIFANLLSETHQIGDGNYSFVNALEYVFLTLPMAIYQIFPTIMLIGVLVGLGSLASYSELTVMRTSGLSLVRIATAVIGAGLILIVLTTFIGEGLAPQLGQFANDMKATAKNKGQAVSTLRGVWLKEGNDFFTIKRIYKPTEVFGVTRFHFNAEHQLQSASTADKGIETDNVWHFSHVKTSTIGKQKVTVNTQATESWPLSFDLHQFAELDPQFLSLSELDAQAQLQTSDVSSSNRLMLTFWSRIFQPLLTIIMILVAIPFIFGPLRSVSIGLRLLSGITVGLVFYILNEFLSQFGLVYQIPPLVAALMLPLVFFCFAIFLFSRKS